MDDRARHERISALFREALRASAEARELLVHEGASGDAHLAAEVLSLLREHASDGPLEDAPSGRLGVAPLASVMGLWPGGQIEDFKLIRQLGVGGMGEVWMAHKRSTGGIVALKVVRSTQVEREVRAAGRLRHQGIVQVHQTGNGEGFSWISMEYVEGGKTLRDAIHEAREARQLSTNHDRAAAETIAKIADALEAAHAARVVHRDIKPGNILMTASGDPKVADFGVAFTDDDVDRTRTEDSWRTPSYCSPEQAVGKRSGIDHRTDVFSLGSVFYELLTLRRPFEGDSPALIDRQVRFEDPPDPRAIRSRVPRDLATICAKCMEKERERRYASMADLAADLRRFLANQPILAKPPGAWGCLVRWCRRNPTKTAAAAVAAVALVVISALVADNNHAKTLAETRLNDLGRLSDLQKCQDLLAEVDRLWPLHPETLDGLRAWTGRAHDLVAKLATHERTLEALRRSGQPAAVAQPADDGTGTLAQKIERLEAIAAFKRRSLLQRRDGVPADLPTLDWSDLPQDAGGLLDRAWPLVAKARVVSGREPEGYVLALRAVERAQESADATLIGKANLALASAACALGRLDEAHAAGQRAVEHVAEPQRESYRHYVADLEGFIRTAKSEKSFATAQREIADIEAEIASLRASAPPQRDVWHFPDTSESQLTHWWHATLSRLIELCERIQMLASRDDDAVSADHGWSVGKRIAYLEQLRDRMAEGGPWRQRWRAASAAIRDHAKYGGLELEPQLGLVPIGTDPDSGLWEFWHIATGTEPAQGDDGRLQLREETGVVLVLIPGGRFWMGAQSRDPDRRNYDPAADEGSESPVHEVELSPFFLSKFELTQGQWRRFTGRNRSTYGPDGTWEDDWVARHPERSYLHPLESVSWLEARSELERMGLALPSEAQWEYACRAGTSHVWCTGDTVESLGGAVNLPDAYARAHDGQETWRYLDGLDDGATIHNRVGSYRANDFGLHDMHGNLEEWCEDGFKHDFYRLYLEAVRDPVAPWLGSDRRVVRGGRYSLDASYARSAYRNLEAPWVTSHGLGVRPARALER